MLFGNASGPAPLIDPLTLMAKGSLILTRPTLPHYTVTREEIRWRAGAFFEWISSGEVKVHIAHTFPLADAAEAHRMLEGRSVIGKVMLMP